MDLISGYCAVILVARLHNTVVIYHITKTFLFNFDYVCSLIAVSANAQVLFQKLIRLLSQWLRAEYSLLVEVLEPTISVKAKEELAAVLVAVHHHLNNAQDFLTDILVTEVNRLGKLRIFSNGCALWRCERSYVLLDRGTLICFGFSKYIECSLK